MDTSKLYPSKYISSEDLKGGHVTVTIRELKMEVLKERSGAQVAKPILYFQKAKKGLVVNKTNLKTLQSVLRSKDSNKWTNKQIDLYSIPVQFGDEMRQGIRIAAAGNGKSAVPDLNDDVPDNWEPDEPADNIPDEEDPFK